MGLFAEIAYGPSPAFAAGAASTGAALPAGVYTYLAAFVVAGGISGQSAQVPVTVAGAGGVNVTFVPAFVPAGATGFQLYRTTRGGGTFYQVTSSPFALASAGIAILDVTSDATLVTNPALSAATVVGGGLLSVQRLRELTNPDTPQGVAGGINYQALQSAVWQAQGWFFAETGVPYDDTTPSGPPPTTPTNQPGASFPPPGGNCCHWVGVLLTIKKLYDYRARPFPPDEVAAAGREANEALLRWKTQFGSARWAAPGTDSNYAPSNVQPGTLPDMDAERLTRLIPDDPRPFTGSPYGQSPAGGSIGEY